MFESVRGFRAVRICIPLVVLAALNLAGCTPTEVGAGERGPPLHLQGSLKDDAGQRYVGHANFHPIAHAIRNPVELMGAVASMTTGGVLERHPKLRCAFLEGTAGWLHWWLWRLDDHWEKFGPGCERQLSKLPSEYFKSSCYIALDVDEEPAVDVVNKMGAEYFVVSSDYPHSDGAFPEAIQQFLGLPFNAEQRRKILWENCARLYGIPTPAAALTRELPTLAPTG